VKKSASQCMVQRVVNPSPNSSWHCYT